MRAVEYAVMGETLAGIAAALELASTGKEGFLASDFGSVPIEEQYLLQGTPIAPDPTDVITLGMRARASVDRAGVQTERNTGVSVWSSEGVDEDPATGD